MERGLPLLIRKGLSGLVASIKSAGLCGKRKPMGRKMTGKPVIGA